MAAATNAAAVGTRLVSSNHRPDRMTAAKRVEGSATVTPSTSRRRASTIPTESDETFASASAPNGAHHGGTWVALTTTRLPTATTSWTTDTSVAYHDRPAMCSIRRR